MISLTTCQILQQFIDIKNPNVPIEQIQNNTANVLILSGSFSMPQTIKKYKYIQRSQSITYSI